MALTDAQKVDARRWMGYPVLGDGETDDVYSSGAFSVSLSSRLDTLTAAEETALVDAFMTPIAALETAVTTAGDNLDTLKAGPWEANPNEVSQRTALYKQWRRDMCAFLGFAPGPALGAGGGMRIVRC